MSKVGVHIIGGVLVIPRTRGTNPCIGLAVSEDRGGEGLSNVDSVLWHP